MTPILPAMAFKVPVLLLLKAINSTSYFVNSASSMLHFDRSSVTSRESLMSKNISRVLNSSANFCKGEESFLLMIDSWSEI